MSKHTRTVGIACCIFLLIALAGCGNPPLTRDDVTGTWYTDLRTLTLRPDGTGTFYSKLIEQETGNGTTPIRWEFDSYDGASTITVRIPGASRAVFDNLPVSRDGETLTIGNQKFYRTQKNVAAD